MTFIAGEWQVEGGISPGVNTVEVKFRGSEGDEGWKGPVLVRTMDGGNKRGEALELLQELYHIHKGRLDLSPLAYRRTEVGRYGRKSKQRTAYAVGYQ